MAFSYRLSTNQCDYYKRDMREGPNLIGYMMEDCALSEDIEEWAIAENIEYTLEFYGNYEAPDDLYVYFNKAVDYAHFLLKWDHVR